MKGVKFIVFLSFILMFYPVLFVPSAVKEWGAAIIAFTIFAISCAILFVNNENSTDDINQIFKDTPTSNKSEITE